MGKIGRNNSKDKANGKGAHQTNTEMGDLIYTWGGVYSSFSFSFFFNINFFQKEKKNGLLSL